MPAPQLTELLILSRFTGAAVRRAGLRRRAADARLHALIPSAVTASGAALSPDRYHGLINANEAEAPVSFPSPPPATATITSFLPSKMNGQQKEEQTRGPWPAGAKGWGSWTSSVMGE